MDEFFIPVYTTDITVIFPKFGPEKDITTSFLPPAGWI